MKTELELIKEAWQVQDASNILGVANRFKEILWELRELKLNPCDHIVTTLFVDKLAHLAGTQYNDQKVANAFNKACKIALDKEQLK